MTRFYSIAWVELIYRTVVTIGRMIDCSYLLLYKLTVKQAFESFRWEQVVRLHRTRLHSISTGKIYCNSHPFTIFSTFV